ncbi:MAG: DUF3106 domain-containing protein [Gallionella sp.]|nr:DUF3106 domain-containing protein [Gallionella sp.]
MKYFITAILLLVFGFAQPAYAATTWQSLNASQREALLPLAKQWEKLPDLQQRNLLRMAKHYPNLTPAQKQRFQNKLIAWSKLTPEQRKIARERYRSLSKDELAKRQEKQKLSVAQPLAVSISAPSPVSSISSVESAIEPTQPSH